jgi:phage repressor protein C with HTH and peptisase S24 domain
MKKVGVSLLIIFAIILIGGATLYFLIVRQQGQYVPASISEVGCVYTVSVAGDSMTPAIKSGTVLSLNKCIQDKNNLTTGKVILFEDGGMKKVGRIKEKLTLAEGVFYKISRDNRPGEEITISSNSILAVSEIQ